MDASSLELLWHMGGASHIARITVISVLVRALPFAIYAGCTPRLSGLARAACLCAYAGCAAAAFAFFDMPRVLLTGGPLVCAYFCGVACCALPLRARFHAGRLDRGALFVASIFACMVVPGLAAPVEIANVALVFGFELTFSLYSVCVEPAARQIPLPQVLHFLLVNPTLAYPFRGSEIGAPALHWRGVARAIAGVLTMALQYAAIALLPLLGLTYVPEVIRIHGHADYERFVAVIGANLVVWYWGHSGVASFQIGLMRLLGYEIPERYRLPFLARSPQDFWSRWNTYIGIWLYRYAFAPLALTLTRASVHRVAASALSVVVAFTLCGALHELAIYMETYQLPMGTVIAFFLAGVGLVAWEGVERLVRTLRRPHAMPASRLRTACVAGVGWGLALHGGLLFAWLFIPAIARQGLPRPLLALVGL